MLTAILGKDRNTIAEISEILRILVGGMSREASLSNVADLFWRHEQSDTPPEATTPEARNFALETTPRTHSRLPKRSLGACTVTHKTQHTASSTARHSCTAMTSPNKEPTPAQQATFELWLTRY